MKYLTFHASLALVALLLVYQPNALSHGVGARGANTLDWHTEDISRVVSPEATWGNLGVCCSWSSSSIAVDLSGIKPDWEVGRVFSQPSRVVEIQGKQCLQGQQFDFDVSDVLAFDIDEEVQVEIDFDLQTSDSMVGLAYDKSGGAAEVLAISLPDRGEERLHTERTVLARARFAGRGDYATDLMVLSAGGPGSSITICDVRIMRSFETERVQAYGRLTLTVQTESGEPTPARVGLYDESGRAPLPSQAAVQMKEFSDLTRMVLLLPATVNWPSENRYTFYTDGSYATRLPAGKYELIISKGVEYHIARREIKIEPHTAHNVIVELERWTDMPSQNWYSGDVHIHFPRRDARENQSMWLQAQAEDLHVANTLFMNNIATEHYPQFDWGRDPGFGEGIHMVIPGQEGPRSTVRGHTIHLNIQEPVKNPDRYLLYHEIFEAMSAQGGISGFAHGVTEVLRTRPGLALEAPYGLVKFMEVQQRGLLGTDMWFDFLNLGYKIAPAAGSDYPYGGHIGDGRSYVRSDAGYSPDNWFQGLSDGRTFVTNGPMVDLELNGSNVGDEVTLSAGESIVISARASINPDIDLLDRIELIEQGEIVASARSESGSEVLQLSHELEAEQGTWFVLRAYGKTAVESGVAESPAVLSNVLPTAGYVAAVTAPIYVSVDGQRTWKRAAVVDLATRMKAELDRVANLSLEAVGGFEEWWQTGPAWTSTWDSQHALLVERIQQVKAKYDELIELAENVK